jgi:hypothetical protein
MQFDFGRRSKRRCEILNVTPDGGRLSTFGLMKLVIVASLRSLIARGQYAPPIIEAMHIDPSIIPHSSHNCATRAEMSFSVRPTCCNPGEIDILQNCYRIQAMPSIDTTLANDTNTVHNLTDIFQSSSSSPRSKDEALR